MILGKGMTGGYLGHAATLATTEVYNSFLGDDRDKALMHGPTFMANALACAVALESIRLIEEENYLQKIARIEAIIHREFDTLEFQGIVHKRIIGAIGAIEFKEASMLAGFNAFARTHGVWLRPIGNILYLMPPYIIEEQEIVSVINVMRTWCEQEQK
jgi:adenosylmethionine-8-amino-7-oxononanoate aminotransferase